MPPLTPPTVPTGQLNYVDECIEAVIARLAADPNFEVGGNLGIATIEREYPQPDDSPRDYPRASLPALAVSAKSEASEWIACGTRNLPVEVRVRCVVESGVTRTAQELLQKIMENVRLFLQQQISIYTGTFLTSDAGVGENGIAQISDVVQMPNWQFRFYADMTLPIEVIHNAPTGGPF